MKKDIEIILNELLDKCKELEREPVQFVLDDKQYVELCKKMGKQIKAGIHVADFQIYYYEEDQDEYEYIHMYKGILVEDGADNTFLRTK